MLKNLRRANQEKDKINSELFKYTKICKHGFVHQPSALSYDTHLCLLALGTGQGGIQIFGKHGIEAELDDPTFTDAVQQLIFMSNQDAAAPNLIISVCDNGNEHSLHLWRIYSSNNKIESSIKKVKSCVDGRLQNISVCRLSAARECLYIGTEAGHIYLLDLNTFQLKDHIIYQDIVMKSLPNDDAKSNGGSAEDIKVHTTQPEKLLLAYKKGLIVLWNEDEIKIECCFVAPHCVESIHWNSIGDGFISSHENGSLCLWSISDVNGMGTDQEQSTPFGPFPCKSIFKVEWYDSLIVFSGGLPRASYSDKHCITVMIDNDVHSVLDFSSKIIDFLLIKSDSQLVPSTLMVLCEEELVAIDLQLQESSFTTYVNPYLSCIHSSNITASTYVYDCPIDLWEYIKTAGYSQEASGLSAKPWPITGGGYNVGTTGRKDMVITGHEDGSVKFWDASVHSFQLLCTIETAKLFQSDFDGPPPEDGVDDWPPFKKVGNFDPFLDDSRYVIQKILFNSEILTLLIGGSGGQVLVYDLSKKHSEAEMGKLLDINVIENLHGFEWKGPGPLTLASVDSQTSKFLPSKCLQIKPSAPITAMAMESSAGLIAVGTCHGLILYDRNSDKVVLVKCTVNPTDLANTGAGIVRKRTLVKSLRDSFRRLKSRRKSKQKKKIERDPSRKQRLDYNEEPICQSRLVGEERVDESVSSMVRCLYFGETYLGDASKLTLTLWVGTNAGYIHAYNIIIPDSSETDRTIKAEIGKQVRLMHHAPVIGIFVINKDGIPIGSTIDSKSGSTSSPEISGAHSVVILSEEQLKIFSLPAMRPKNKLKLTAVDGSRLRKVGIIKVHAKEGSNETIHHYLECLTNLGDVIVFSIPFLREQYKVNVAKREDIRAISSLLFTRHGELYFMKSPSQLQRIGILMNSLMESNIIHSPVSSELSISAYVNETPVLSDATVDRPVDVNSHSDSKDNQP